ncbi:MBL fold metallo-hydrolase [Aureisphaera galaxeae]|uniref:MBL fold metallo-hydrolase n=1 Tax=Aureisphaera galaxeae TaxID=1538023 RepID=UPI002350E25B|nr:MBL fold metallo-hydrolase [Aureisphaera galaxeae]MDC8003967.1 MBL fold metallo-hydrolase [Aureisphaera galaxeae]
MKSPLTVTFLGTGTSQGIPVIGSTHPVCLSKDPKDKRLRVSVLIQWDDHTIVVDCGPDFRQQMLRENVNKIEAVLITHEHNDHVAGIDDIRPFYFRQGDIPFYAEDRVFKALHKRFAYVFEVENKYPGAPTITEHTISKEQTFQVLDREVIPIEVMHGSLPVLGFRIDGFAYLTDVKTIAEEEMEKLKGTEVLVLNALREEPHNTHLNIEEALEIVQKIQPKKAYFTHISHLMGFHEEVEARLPENVHLAYDTLTITI